MSMNIQVQNVLCAKILLFLMNTPENLVIAKSVGRDLIGREQLK